MKQTTAAILHAIWQKHTPNCYPASYSGWMDTSRLKFQVVLLTHPNQVFGAFKGQSSVFKGLLQSDLPITSILEQGDDLPIVCGFCCGHSNRRSGLLDRGASQESVMVKELLRQNHILLFGGKSKTFSTSGLPVFTKLQIIFLGTSVVPTADRSASSAVLKFEDTGSLLFDCGEGTYRQLQRTAVRPYDINKIFIRQMEPDYILGLPSFLCSKAMQAENLEHPIEVFGPPGLRRYVRVNLRACFMRVPTKFVVHEFVVNEARSNDIRKWTPDEELHEDELIGKDILSSEDDTWHLYEDDKVRVKAIQLDADLFSWGFIIEQDASHLKTQGLQKIDFQERSRKVVFAGCGLLNKVSSLKSADLLVYDVAPVVRGLTNLGPTFQGTMAGRLAKMLGAESLVLTRFEFEDQARDKIHHLLDAARSSFGTDAVIAAKDLMVLAVGQ